MTEDHMVRIGDIVVPPVTWNPARINGDTTFTYIDLAAVDQKSKTIARPRQLFAREAPSRARQVVAHRDVLVSTVRPNLNAVALVPEALNAAIASTGFCVLRPNPAKLDSSYLFHWVKAPEFVSRMVQRATGASYPAVTDRTVLSAEIPLPPLPDQRRIADILDRAEALRDKRRCALAHLDSLVEAIFVNMFGSPTANPKGYPVATMIELVDPKRPITYGILKPGDDVPDGVPYVRVVDMIDRSIHSAGLRRTTKAISLQYKRSLLCQGDLLLSIRGQVGRLAIVGPDVAGANITQDTARLAIAGADPTYVLECLRTPELQRWMSTHTKGAAVRGINLTDVKRIEVPLPPPSEQNTFASAAKVIQRTRESLLQSAAKLDLLLASLQHRAFRGAM